MSTYCALHVKTDDGHRFISEVEQYLAMNNRGRVVIRKTANTLGEIYGSQFICSVKQQPTTFGVTRNQHGWFTAHYNSFYPLPELAVDASRTLGTVVIAVTAQSVSSAYLLGVWRDGEHLRTLEFADGEWLRQEGAPLPFEREPLGTNLAEEDEEPYYNFGRRDVIDYCENLGLRLWQPPADEKETDPEEWTIIRV